MPSAFPPLPHPETATAGTVLGLFEVRQVLYRGTRSTVLRCLQDGLPVVVKFLRRSALSIEDVARFRREYELSRRVVHPRVVSASTQGSQGAALFLTMPDDGAVALRDLVQRGPLPLADALQVALALVDALEAVHAQQIVHKDVAPGNVVVDLPRGLVRLIDFGISAEISSERPALAPPQELEGTLACMAPEQTGRMNRDVDYRADFYGLGATLFTLLAGVPPFAATDPVQLVHAHLALPPRPLAELRHDAPAALCAVVARLLAKEPEARYQSHHALRRDLQTVADRLDRPAALTGWVPGLGDLPGRFQVSGRLYGRQDEVARILAAFDAAADGPAQLVTIAGFAGIGKTALVHEVQRSLLGRRGEMVDGKYNQFGQHSPCAAFLQALRQRVRQVLALPADEQQPWRSALAAQLGTNAGLAVAALPEMALLLGACDPVLPLGPVEAENRFLQTMQRCFSALASARQPVVVFIDDLQWADRMSRRLLRELALDDSLRHLLVIGAYRSNEVPPDHPLAADLAALAASGGRSAALSVGPLDLADVAALIADTLQQPVGDPALQEFAALCHAKTGGNPFFLGRFLQDLQRRGLVWLDRAVPRWSWSLARIREERIADNVVALMLEQLQGLPADTRAMLTVAACLDARFELGTLATACSTPADAALRTLAPALAAGMLAPADGRYKWVGVLDAAERAGMRVELSFVHDRVQEAAYLLADPGERPALHLRIGRLLRAGMDPRQPDFAAVNHLNRGAALIDDPQERLDLAGWNATVSERARDAASFDLAADHAARAIALYGDARWQSDPDAALGLQVHAARMAGLAGDTAGMEALLDGASAHRLSDAERARVLDVRVEASYASGRLEETLELGLAALDLLGLQPPAAQGPADAVRLIAQLRDALKAVGIDTLAAQPAMQAALPLQQVAVMARMTAAAYIARPALLPLLTVMQVRLMMAHGHAPAALSAYSVMGLMVAEFLGDYRFGCALGRMSVALVERHGWRQVHAHAGFSFNAFLQHWDQPIGDGLDALMDVHRNGVEHGNLRHAGLGLYLHGCHSFLDGLPLAELEPLLDAHGATLRRIRQPVAHDYLHLLHEVVRALQQREFSGAPLEHEGFSADALLADYTARGDRTGAMFLHALRCMLHALAGRHEAAVAEGHAAETHFAAGRGMAMVPFCVFFTATAAVALARGDDLSEETASATLDAALVRFAPWVQVSDRLMPLWHLLRSHRAGIDGDLQLLQQEADAALATVQALDNLLLRALVHWQRGLLLADAAELAEARTVFLRWGAPAPAQELLFGGAAAALPPSAAMPTQTLDLAALMKVVQAVTAEISLEPLLRRLLQVLQENAGAGRTVVVLRDGEGWALQADSAAGPGLHVPEGLPLEQAGARLPLEILRTVLATRLPVLVDDVMQERAWRGLPYFQQHACRSLLCLPLVRQGQAAGALYLENDAARGVFPQQRIAFLELLCGNVANTIDNARLYAEMRDFAATLERRVDARTHELQESEARTLQVLRNIPLPVTVTRRADGVFVYVNDRAAALSGMSTEVLVGRVPRSMYRWPADRERMYDRYLREGVVRDCEICLVAADGADIWALISMVPILYDGEVADLATIVDITERKSAEDALRTLASVDHLTGLASRGHFLRGAQDEIERAFRYGRALALVMLDVDYFKQINDSHGHAAGDDALCAVAQACRSTARAHDLAGRLGGEEFCILMPETQATTAEALAERLRSTLAGLSTLSREGVPMPLTASFGVTELQPGDTLDTLLARADAALYAAKGAGRNRVRVAAVGPPVPQVLPLRPAVPGTLSGSDSGGDRDDDVHGDAVIDHS